MPKLLTDLHRVLKPTSKVRMAGIALAAFVVIGGGVILAKGPDQATDASMQPADAIVMTKDDAMAMERDDSISDAAMTETQAPVSESAMPMPSADMAAPPATAPAAAPAPLPGSFSDYAPAKLADANRGSVVLFFSASWCPTCQTANKNFEATAAPEGLSLLKVNYDDSTDLKRKYGVTYQHTLVQVDSNGNQLKKWHGSTSYDAIKAQLN